MGILSGDNNLLFRDNCVGKNKSLEDFQECLRKSKVPLIQNVRMNSYKQYLSLNEYSATDMILPYNGSIGVIRDWRYPTFELDSAYSFLLALFDKDFFLYVTNPLIIHRSVLKVVSNTSQILVGIKVGGGSKYKDTKIKTNCQA